MNSSDAFVCFPQCGYCEKMNVLCLDYGEPWVSEPYVIPEYENADDLLGTHIPGRRSSHG